MLRNIYMMVAVMVLCHPTLAGKVESGLRVGTPELKSAGPLAFGPDGILFIGDTRSAAVFAIQTQDQPRDPKTHLDVDSIDEKVAGLLGTTADDIRINDLAINPAGGNAYLSVSRGRGPDAHPVLLKVHDNGKLSEVDLKNIPFAKTDLPNAPAPGGEGRQNKRRHAITDLAYIDGRVFIAGLSNEEFESTLRWVPFPFSEVEHGASLKIYHGAHGRFETHAPVRTFAPYLIQGEPHLLAAYTCTPLVKFPIVELTLGAKVQGTTIAELGNRNRPIDMFVYEKDGKNFVLLANSARGMMKITTDNIDNIEGITKHITDGQTAGLPYETITAMKSVEQLDRLNENNAVVLIRTESGGADLRTVALP